MKNSIYSKIPILIGTLNWISVIAILLGVRYANIGNPNGAKWINDLTLSYLKFSFITAIISIVLTIIIRSSSKASSAINYTINILYLVLYTTVFLLLKDMSP